jgi:hypothetical protein
MQDIHPLRFCLLTNSCFPFPQREGKIKIVPDIELGFGRQQNWASSQSSVLRFMGYEALNIPVKVEPLALLMPKTLSIVGLSSRKVTSLTNAQTSLVVDHMAIIRNLTWYNVITCRVE